MVWGLKGIIVLQLVLVLLGFHSSNVMGEATIALPPALPPIILPIEGPSPLPYHPPPPPAYRPARNKTLSIAVEGVIFCKSCKLRGYIKAIDASPLPGVGVRVQCRYGKYVAVQTGKTDARGYFLVDLLKVKTAAIPGCKAYVVSLPPACNKPFFPVGVRTGVSLKFERFVKEGTAIYGLYTAGLLEFAPAKRKVCPRV